ncbi:DUF4245 family protein [Nocardioides sp. AE5]|uniref:DUF4245 family protein n=1 Tax=Nocardioides sp. AE5 TaxID=2962573 RepID=UPI0028821999|nr:DUF4245 family protein [Nocardioides sp. AE5]MDT0202173.1 DUF4245 family protein [Nocardioides sp. AE5]
MSAGGAGRYTRRNSGMLGAMLVTIAVIVAFVLFRAVTRDDLVVEREAIDYLSVVEQIQTDAGPGAMQIAYPPALPAGTKAVNVGYDPTRQWKVDLLADGRFIGIYQGRFPMTDWVEQLIDPDAESGDDVRLDSELGETWQSWTDDGGDYGVGIELDDTVLLVFGTADPELVREVAASLVTTPLEQPGAGD